MSEKIVIGFRDIFRTQSNIYGDYLGKQLVAKAV